MVRRRKSRVIRKRKTRRIRKLKGGEAAKEFSFYNSFHYGDHIWNLRFFFNNAALLKSKGIKIKYFYDSSYIKNLDELKRYVDPDVVTLDTGSLPDGAIELWIGRDINGIKHTALEPYFVQYYGKIVTILGLEGENINTSLYQKEDYLQDIYNKLDDKFKDLDILMINAAPQSGQYSKFDAERFKEACIKLSKKYKIASTSEADPSISCTMRDGLLLQDIGAISTHAKYIIGVQSGPIVPCYNEAMKQNVKKIIYFDDAGMMLNEVPTTRLFGEYNVRDVEKNMI
jgi:hypothetical protein